MSLAAVRVTCAFVVVIALAGCATNTETWGGPGEGADMVGPVAKVEAIAALLPAKIRDSGKMMVGVNVPYVPNEFRDSSGKIVGFDVDLMNAVSQVLGVVPQYLLATFEKIIPAVQAGTFDVGMSSFTDKVERRKTVDFTDYFRAGVQWAQQTGRPRIDPDNACGLKVAVQATTLEDTDEVPDKSARCVAEGKDPIIKMPFGDQSAATTALILGQVDAMSVDSPVTAYALKQTDGRLEKVGPLYLAAPYGWPVAKGSPLAKALQQAVQHLMDNGDYRKIAENWGVQSGMIDRSTVNGALQ